MTPPDHPRESTVHASTVPPNPHSSFPLLFIITHTETSKAGPSQAADKREPMEGKQVKRKDPTQIRFLLEDYMRGDRGFTRTKRRERMGS